MLKWIIKDVLNFVGTDYKNGIPWYGFHDRLGVRYICSYFGHYIGCIMQGKIAWTAGEKNPELSDIHYKVKFDTPKYICRMYHQNTLLISEKKYIYKLDLDTMSFNILIDCDEAHIVDSGCCVCDYDDNIWINDVQGGAIFRFSATGEYLERIGQKNVGFNKGAVSFEEAAFNWIYDIRLGPDGHLYVLDSKNYAVRKMEINSRTVTTICGNGTPGNSPLQCSISEARFGASPNEHFDGPWSLFVDESNNIIIGDTWNQALRVIEHDTKMVKMIAPIDNDVTFKRICGMDYCKGIVYVPDWFESKYTLTVIEKLNETV